jgi:hypothetical protein
MVKMNKLEQMDFPFKLYWTFYFIMDYVSNSKKGKHYKERQQKNTRIKYSIGKV